MKVFITVDRMGSFTKAASALGISQPAVSQNISELEKSLGVTLFHRCYGKIETTASGKILRHYALRIAGDYAGLNAAFQPEEADVLNLYFSPLLDGLIAEDVVAVLKVLRPGLSVKCLESEDGADVYVMAVPDKTAKDTGIMIDVHVLPEDHQCTPLLKEAIELARLDVLG